MIVELTAGLILLMIGGALIAIETRNLLAAVVSVGAVGYLLSIVFLFLGAPDIAITQIVVEILCLVILIRATVSRDLTSVSGDRELVGLLASLTLLLAATLVVIRVSAYFPDFGSAVMDRI
ncbi:MAG TPA: DUF4040 domain-containing protein, partial [Kiritimatiellae bacterium]|nr:DUF4040 domain-containing protein [Kiritimatiellia bacterium]